VFDALFPLLSLVKREKTLQRQVPRFRIVSFSSLVSFWADKPD